MTATEASRSFAQVLDQAERGETIVITRGGRRVAAIGPTPTANGAAVASLLLGGPPDEDFAADVEATRAAVFLEAPAWPEG
jgi:antitoxin (DNA-binding transcriptional repressor) of toxin-antitoxin stability system